MVYNNFVDPGNQMNETAWSSRLLLGIVSFSGSILLGGVLISTISNIIERRVDVVNTGRMTYRNITQHYVLIGFNELTINMIRELYNECPSGTYLADERYRGGNGTPSHTVCLARRNRAASACLLWQH